MNRGSQTTLCKISRNKVLNEWYIQKCHKSLVRDWSTRISAIGESFPEEVILHFFFEVAVGQKGKNATPDQEKALRDE